MKTLSFQKGCTDAVSKYFLAKEFDCPCPVCSMTFIEEDLLKLLDLLRERLATPLKITSGYRCDYHQRELAQGGLETAKGRSTHQDGRAADVWTGHHSGMEIERAARAVGFMAVGVAQKWAHLDTRQDRARFWGYRP